KSYWKSITTKNTAKAALHSLTAGEKKKIGRDERRNAVDYSGKRLKGHNMLQGNARVKRQQTARKHGVRTDYRGILIELDTSIQDYQDLAEQTQAGYEIDDLKGTVANVSTEYKRLPALHDALWEIFSNVKNRADFEQFRRVLIPRLSESDDGS